MVTRVYYYRRNVSRLALLDSGRGEFTRDLRGWFRSFLESQTTAVLTQLVKASGQALFPSAGKPPAGKCTRSVGFLLEHNQHLCESQAHVLSQAPVWLSSRTP